MLVRGDYGVNLLLRHEDSLKGSLRQTMLLQEDVFKKQVYELHQLYNTQKILMEELGRKEMNVYHLEKGNIQTNLGLFSCHGKYEANINRPFSSISTVSTGISMTNSLQERRNILPRLRERSILQFSVNQMESRITEDSFDEGNGSGKKAIQAELKQLFCGKTASPCDEVNLSLSIGCEEFAPITTDNASDLPPNTSIRSQLYVNKGSNFLELDSEGAPERIEVHSCENMFKGKVVTFCDGAELDLNIALPDDSASHSDTHHARVSSSSRSFDSLVSQFHMDTSPTKSSKCSNEVSVQQDTRSFLIASNCSAGTTNIFVSGESVSGLPVVHNKGPGISQEETHRCVGMLDEIGVKDSGTPAHAAEGSTEDISSTTSHVLRSSVCFSDNVPRSRSTRNDSGISDISPSNMLQDSELSQNAKLQCSQDTNCSGIGDVKGADTMVRKGAVSLIYFWLKNSGTENDSRADISQSNEIEFKNREQPQSSLDSFESIALKLPLSNLDDCCVSSIPLEANDCKKDYGVMLKSGRRLKDFQKDILPGLASLSRQEIREDVKIMEGALRSREYKKLRSRMTRVHACFTPVRSKRSRLGYVRRKFY